jgi:DNA polymerase-4
VRGSERLFGPPAQIARTIKDHIRDDLRLTASVGVAPNKFLAKLASDLKKPDGLVVIEPDQVNEVLAPLPVSRLWGVGKKGEKRLHQLGLRTIGQLAALPEQVLVAHFGESGRHLWQLAHGLDDRLVVPDQEAKSISSETTFARDIASRRALRSVLLELTEEVSQRLRSIEARAATVDLKVRTAAFVTHHRSVTLPEPTDLTDGIWQAASVLFDQRVPHALFPVRLIGIGLSGLVRHGSVQGQLFDDEKERKRRAADAAADRIRERFGAEALHRGSVLDRPD